MKKDKIILTSNLMLRPFTYKDITPKYIRWLNDKELMKYSDQKFTKHTRTSCVKYFSSFKGTDNLFLAVIKDGRHIGNITVDINKNHSVADIRILMSEHGYGTEAFKAVCDYLLSKNIRKITAGTLSINIPMLRVMEKCGMVDDGIRKCQCMHENREADIVYKALFRKGKK